MQTYTLRLKPGQDLRRELEAFAFTQKLRAGLVLTCVGSLTQAALRLANAEKTSFFTGHFEIVSLVGTLSPDGIHLHISISDEKGQIVGGHLMEGSLIYTTAEIVLGELAGIVFHRPIDPQTGYDELVVDYPEA
jgi:predicted DNA-binding protein with PD1-like motif